MNWPNAILMPYLPPSTTIESPIPNGQALPQFITSPTSLNHYEIFTLPSNQIFANFPFSFINVIGQVSGQNVIEKCSRNEDTTILKNEKERKQIQEKIEKQQKHPHKDKQVKEFVCQCKNSHCIKEYCFCFKNGVGCTEKCGCHSCRNTPNKTNSKLRAKKSKTIVCSCSKSQCSKKYCECYAANKKCGATCRCINCKN